MKLEVNSDDEFFEIFLAILTDKPYPKMITNLDIHGKPLDAVKTAWAATIAEEQGFDPIVANLADDIPYLIMVAPQTKLVGYLSISPQVH